MADALIEEELAEPVRVRDVFGFPRPRQAAEAVE
jgi:hypothetical protein